MHYRWIGAGLIVAACGGFGIFAAGSHRREEAMLRQLENALSFMECQLQFRMTPLPELCFQTARQVSGPVGALFSELAKELELQLAPEAAGCMHTVLGRCPGLSPAVRDLCLQLGRSLGRFDLAGQLKGLTAVQRDSQRKLEALCRNRDTRLRSYQTLGFCAGAALAILFI